MKKTIKRILIILGFLTFVIILLVRMAYDYNLYTKIYGVDFVNNMMWLSIPFIILIIVFDIWIRKR